MRFCSNCGKPVNDTDKFCAVCGAPQYNVQQPYNPYSPVQNRTLNKQPNSHKWNSDKIRKILPKMAIVTVSIVVVLIVLINCLNARGSMTASGAVKNYYSAINSRNGNKFLKATLSKQMQKAACKLQGCSKSQLLRYAKSDLKEYTYQVKNIEIIDKNELDGDAIDMINSISLISSVKIKVSKAYEITYKFTYIVDGDFESRTRTSIVYKSGGRWYFMSDTPFEYREDNSNYY